MGNPLFKASEGGRFDILRVGEDIIQSEARQVSGMEVLISIKRAPRTLSEWVAHARLVRLFATDVKLCGIRDQRRAL